MPTAASAAVDTPPKEVANRNFFASLRATIIDTDSTSTEAITHEETVPGKANRPPPIVLTSKSNLINLQKQLISVVKDDFEFRNTRNGTRVITKGMADFEVVISHFTNNKLIKAVIRHLPPNTPAEDISEGLGNLGFDVVSVNR
jgi:hypothetical protein